MPAMWKALVFVFLGIRRTNKTCQTPHREPVTASIGRSQVRDAQDFGAEPQHSLLSKRIASQETKTQIFGRYVALVPQLRSM